MLQFVAVKASRGGLGRL